MDPARITELQAELDKIRHQKRELTDKILAWEAAHPPANRKRPAEGPHPDTPEAKKLNMMKNREKRVQGIFKQCETIVKMLSKCGAAIWFLKDPTKAKLQNYDFWVKQPMWLGKVQDKLTKKEFKDVCHFREDVRLIFNNARIYNPEHSDARRDCEILSDRFEKDFFKANLEARWNYEMAVQQQENAELQVGHVAVHSRGAAEAVGPLSLAWHSSHSLATAMLQLLLDR